MRGRGVLFVCGIAREFYGGRGTFSVRLNAEGDTPPVGMPIYVAKIDGKGFGVVARRTCLDLRA